MAFGNTLTRYDKLALAFVDCPKCGSKVSQYCTSVVKTRINRGHAIMTGVVHRERRKAMQAWRRESTDNWVKYDELLRSLKSSKVIGKAAMKKKKIEKKV